MRLKFHIIYLPETVRYLTPLVNSLLAWSDCEYCLVANGCAEKEQHDLKVFCQKDQRLSFLHLPFEEIVSHGKALNYLQKHTSLDYFCFMDSDIFATGPFMTDFESALKTNQGVFSGTPLWCKAEDGIVAADYPRIYGRHHHDQSGLCIGGTYFAIYDNNVLSNVAQKQGIDFKTKRVTTLSTAEEELMATLKMNKTFYDTGKVLNFSLLKKGYQLAYLENEHLHHLGGFSRFAKIQSRTLKEKLNSHILLLKKGQFHSFLIQLPYYLPIERWIPITAMIKKSILLRQIIVEKYISNLIITLITRQPKPKWKTSKSIELDKKIAFITIGLISIYENK